MTKTITSPHSLSLLNPSPLFHQALLERKLLQTVSLVDGKTAYRFRTMSWTSCPLLQTASYLRNGKYIPQSYIRHGYLPRIIPRIEPCGCRARGAVTQPSLYSFPLIHTPTQRLFDLAYPRRFLYSFIAYPDISLSLLHLVHDGRRHAKGHHHCRTRHPGFSSRFQKAKAVPRRSISTTRARWSIDHLDQLLNITHTGDTCVGARSGGGRW